MCVSAYEHGWLENPWVVGLKPDCALFLFKEKTSLISYLHFISFNWPSALFIWGFLFVYKPERGEKNHSVYEEYF